MIPMVAAAKLTAGTIASSMTAAINSADGLLIIPITNSPFYIHLLWGAEHSCWAPFAVKINYNLPGIPFVRLEV